MKSLFLALVLTLNFNIYPMTAIVTEVNHTTDIVTIEDFNGNLWQFDGAEDWQVNDICSCLMGDNGTSNIYDDEILKVRYSGWVE